MFLEGFPWVLRLIEVDVGGVEQSGLELRNSLLQRSLNQVGGPLDSRNAAIGLGRVSSLRVLSIHFSSPPSLTLPPDLSGGNVHPSALKCALPPRHFHLIYRVAMFVSPCPPFVL